MERSPLKLDGAETLCVYSCLCSELRGLNLDLEDEDLTEEEIAQARRSINICNSVIRKIKAANPNSKFSYED